MKEKWILINKRSGEIIDTAIISKDYDGTYKVDNGRIYFMKWYKSYKNAVKYLTKNRYTLAK